ncbi:MAG: ATP-binding cassette domain-containing protein [Candidatus Eisenbacteria sp.]|nr:ATP-binding cassette domain-containing protein [Candidatus Eisenbacteria bacterium]
MDKPHPIAEVQSLSAGFGGRSVLEDINLDIHEGEILVVLGKSGCGKSTLLKHMVGLLKPSAGSVRLFGIDIFAADEPEMVEVLKKVGVLFQYGALLNSLYVHENVAIPLEQHTDVPPSVIRRLVEAKLGLVRLTGTGHLLPSELSGGMRKRAALARALALDPDILFADEPSAGLDPMTTAHQDDLLLELREDLGMTMVVVTHELASIHRIADRIAFLEDKKILFLGTVSDAKGCGVEIVEEFFRMGTFA